MVCCAVLAGLLSGGCAGSREAARRENFLRVVMPTPPSFLTGPCSVLLTNEAGFGAHLEVQAQRPVDTERSSSGQLLGRGTKLLYVPQTEENTDTHRQPGGYSFIWDVTESRGYVLSEALQGYAPVAAVIHVTNVLIDPEPTGAQRFSGHACEPARARVQMADGTTAGFNLLRAIDLKEFPVRIESATNANVFTLSMSKILLEPPSPKVFAPPEGFTQYASPETMADELAARQHNLKRKTTEPLQPIPGVERRY
jgi:hypothetical protein